MGQLTDNQCKSWQEKSRQLTAQTVSGIAGATVSRIAEATFSGIAETSVSGFAGETVSGTVCEPFETLTFEELCVLSLKPRNYTGA